MVTMVASCKQDPPHSHTFSEDWKYDSTSHWHEATCEHTEVKGDEAGHDLVSVAAKEPTCTEVGWDAYVKCSVCGYTTYVEKAATGHSFSEDWTKDATYHWHAATCEHTTEVSGKAEHDWDEGTQTTAPGYGTAGVKTYTCNTCGQTKTEPIAALAAKDNTVTYTGSTSKDYDGNVISLESDKITRSGDGAITIMYKESTEEDSAYTATAPKDAGTYNVKISVAATAEWNAAELVVKYTINKVVLPLQTLTMTYEVLPEATGTGIGAYKSKTFTSADGLPEGVTIKVFPYNEEENGTFTVHSEYKYRLIPNTDDDSAFETALQGARAGIGSLDPDQFFARVDLGPNYTLQENSYVAILTVTPKEITGNITGSKDYDGKAYLEIMGTDLVANGVYEEDKDDVKLLLNVKNADAESNKTVINAATYYTSNNKLYYNYIIKRNSGNVSFNLTINKKKLTVPDLYGPVLTDTSGNTIQSRVVEIGPAYGAVENFTIKLKSSGIKWDTTGYSANFLSKTENPDALYYYEMDEQYSKNYSLDKVFLNIVHSTDSFSTMTTATEYTATNNVFRKITAPNAGREYLLIMNKTEPVFTVTDTTGRILYLNGNRFTTKIAGEVYLVIVGQKGVTSWTYKLY